MNTRTRREKLKKRRKTASTNDGGDYTNEDSIRSASPELKLKEDEEYSNLSNKRKRSSRKVTLTCSEKFEMGQSNKSVSEVEETPVENLDVKYNLESNLIESENELYNIRNANYMERQPYIEPSMRAILADWIMEVCFQFRFKRQTYHTSVMLVDIFMSCTSNMPTHLLQLIGVTCLCIASKNEEVFIPPMETFSVSTASAYTTQEIIECEIEILNKLKWKIQYPTISFWSNYITSKWDDYTINFGETYAYDLNWNNKRLPMFRNQSNEEYQLFRTLNQILDLMSLDYEVLKRNDQCLVASVIYLILGVYLKYFSVSNIIVDFVKDKNSYTNYYELNIIFNRFLYNYMNLELDDIIDHIKYTSVFFNLNLDFTGVSLSDQQENDITYEEFLQYQTHNTSNVKTLQYINNIRGR